MWLTQINFLWLKLPGDARKEKRNMAVAEPNLLLQKSPAEISFSCCWNLFLPLLKSTLLTAQNTLAETTANLQEKLLAE